MLHGSIYPFPTSASSVGVASSPHDPHPPRFTPLASLHTRGGQRPVHCPLAHRARRAAVPPAPRPVYPHTSAASAPGPSLPVRRQMAVDGTPRHRRKRQCWPSRGGAHGGWDKKKDETACSKNYNTRDKYSAAGTRTASYRTAACTNTIQKQTGGGPIHAPRNKTKGGRETHRPTQARACWACPSPPPTADVVPDAHAPRPRFASKRRRRRHVHPPPGLGR